MRIKKRMKNITCLTIAAAALVCGSANAESTGYTGTVKNSFTGEDDYTFVTITTSTIDVSGYYMGNNSAIATILDNAKRLNQEVNVYFNIETGKITHVQ